MRKFKIYFFWFFSSDTFQDKIFGSKKTDIFQNKVIKNKIVLYDHSLDKKQENKWDSKKKLKKISMDQLPEYINNNKNKFNEWLEE